MKSCIERQRKPPDLKIRIFKIINESWKLILLSFKLSPLIIKLNFYLQISSVSVKLKTGGTPLEAQIKVTGKINTRVKE